MNTLCKVTLFSAALLTAVPAMSATHYRAAKKSSMPLNGYISAGGGFGYTVGSDATDMSWPVLFGSFGYGMRPIASAPNFAIEPELRLGFGLGDDKNIKLSNFITISQKFRFGLSRSVDFYAGPTWTRNVTKPKGGDSGSFFTTGMVTGVDFFVTKNIGIGGRMDWTGFVNTFSGGVSVKF